MNIFTKIISAGLSPNTETDDVFIALRMLFRPDKWQKGDRLERVSRWFRNAYHPRAVYTFNSGRSALYALLSAFGIGKGDEVIVQAFTCVAVPNSVLWTGARPVYADIDTSLNIDPKDLEKKITHKTKAVILQHTFGIPAAMEAIQKITTGRHILLIEDCAHSMGSSYNGKPVGSIGDGAFFSFGRDKAMSSVWGGAAMINPSCPVKEAPEKLRKFHAGLPYPNMFWIYQQLLHPVAFAIILPFYASGIGKLLLWSLQKLRLLSYPVYQIEKQAGKPPGFPARYPNGLAALLLNQLRKLPKYVSRRRYAAQAYAKISAKERQRFSFDTDASLLRYPLYVENPELVMVRAKRLGMAFGNWYQHVIDPVGVDLGAVGYSPGSCMAAEEYARHIINVPTLLSASQVKRVVSFLRTI